MSQFLTVISIIFIVIGVFQILKQDRTKEFSNEHCDHMIELPKGFIWFGIIMGIVFILLFALMLLTEKNFTNFDSFVFLALSSISILLAISAYNWKITFNSDRFVYSHY